jgi:TRAP-type uncharacterized transport system substrate-binding protein
MTTRTNLLGRTSLRTRLASISWRDLFGIGLPVLLLAIAAIGATVRFLRPAPPDTIFLLSGPDGSTFRTMAERYKVIIERYGVKVEVLPSLGGLDNLRRLTNPSLKGDVAFVQGGLTDGIETSRLMSLGSVFPQPMMVYYRHPEAVDLLTQLRGKRLAIGPEGSGTRALALALLKANDMAGAPTALDDLAGEEAARALVAGTVDAVFLMGDSATPKVMASLRAEPSVRLMSFRQAAGYVRRLRFLTKLTLPEGAMDLAHDYPPHSTDLVGPTVELVARDGLHPALSDLLITAAREVHGGAGMFRDAGEFPSPLAREFVISSDAERYYKSGEQFLYKRLPFWLASLIDRLLVVILPLLVIVVPATRIAPALYRWRVRSRVYRWYGALMAIEREALDRPGPEQHRDLLARLSEMDAAINGMKTPLSFADQAFVLRQHVAMVRERLSAKAAAPAGSRIGSQAPM